MIDALRRLPGFDALDRDAIAMIVARSTVRRFAPGQIVLPRGEVAESLLARIEGELVDASGRPHRRCSTRQACCSDWQCARSIAPAPPG